MTAAVLFLVRRTIANMVMRSVQRLRQPRYVIGAVLALGYFWWLLFRPDAAVHASRMRHGAANEAMILFVTVTAFVVLAGAWALARTSPGLVFTEAEIQFFFAGPVRRRDLIAYKFVRSQLRGLFSALMFSAFVWRGSHFLGVWIAFVVIDVYTTFVAFARARLKQMGIGWAWRFAAVALVFIAAVVFAERQFRGAQLSPTTIARLAAEPPLGILLAVPRAFATVMYSPSLAAVTAAAALLLLLALLFYAWTVRLDVSFEDESIVASQRVLMRHAQAWQNRLGHGATTIHRVGVPFTLAERGPASAAIAWKNLVGTLRISGFPVVALVVLILIAVSAFVFRRYDDVLAAIGVMGLATAALAVLAGPAALRNDLRTDILRLDVVKTYPVTAEELLASEMAAPLSFLASFELAMIALSVTILHSSSVALPWIASAEFIVAALVFVIPVCALQLLIHNAGIILFPAWSIVTEETKGFTAIGQKLLLLLGNVAALVAALVPAALIFAPSVWLAVRFFGTSPLAILLATLPAAGVLVVEIVVALKWLASQFEDLDIANDFDAVLGT